MNAIADREYDKLASLLLESGLDKLNSDFQGIKINDGDVVPVNELSFHSGTGNELEIVILKQRTAKDVPYQALVEASWRVLRGRSSVPGMLKELQVINEDLVYVQVLGNEVVKFGGPKTQSNLVMKRYRERKRDVFVWRGILEDEKFPLIDDNMRCANTGWFVIENQTTCLDVKVILRIRPPTVNSTRNQPPGIVIESMVTSALQITDQFRLMIESEAMTTPTRQPLQDLKP